MWGSISHGAVVPTVSTSAAVRITCDSAELRASVLSDGDDVCQYRFGYREAGDLSDYTTTDWTGAVRRSYPFAAVVSGLRAGTRYYFAAQAQNSAGPGQWSAERTFVTVGLPSASTAAATDVTCTSATLQGSIVSDSGQACEYCFQYWEAGGESATTTWTGSVRTDQFFSVTISGLRAGATYHFRARCRNCAGESDWANEKTFATVGLPTVTMSAATDITCTSATLRAGVASDGGQACEYQFRYKPVGGEYATMEWTGSVRTSYPLSEAVTGLSAGTTYEYSARARNCAGEGPWASDRRLTTSSSGVIPPRVSTESAAGIGSTSATLGGRLDDDGGAPCAYRFRYKEAGSVSFSFTSWTGPVTAGQPFSHAVSGLEAGVTYYFAAQARNAAGEGGWGGELSFITPLPMRTPQVITLPAADVGTSSATLGGHLEDDGGTACAHRLRYRKAGGSYVYTEWVGSATTGRIFGEIITGLEAGTTYYFAAQARNSAGEGDWGSELNFVTASLVEPPEVTTMPASAVDATSATLFGYLDDDGGSVCEYRFCYYLRRAGPGARKDTGWASGTSREAVFAGVIEGLLRGEEYVFMAQARNAAGTASGEQLSFTTAGASSSRPPTVVHVDDNAPSDAGPNDPTVGDPQEDGTAEHPFDSLGEAIAAAGQGARVLVHDGVYVENVDLMGKSICVEGAWLTDPIVFGMPVIEGTGQEPVVRFARGEDLNCQLLGLVIRGGPGATAPALECRGAGPLIGHCVIASHRADSPGAAVLLFEDSNAVVTQCTISDNVAQGGGTVLQCRNSPGVRVVNCIVWGNVGSLLDVSAGGGPQVLYSDVQERVAGMGNLCVDPLFVGAGYWSGGGPAGPGEEVWVPGDYHLQSRRGRFSAEYGSWVLDQDDSPCLDAGDPAHPCTGETMPNGGRVDMGAFGGTWQASLSPH